MRNKKVYRSPSPHEIVGIKKVEGEENAFSYPPCLWVWFELPARKGCKELEGEIVLG